MLKKLVRDALREELSVDGSIIKRYIDAGNEESKEIIGGIVKEEHAPIREALALIKEELTPIKEELASINNSLQDRNSLLNEIRNVVNEVVREVIAANNSVIEGKIEYFTNLLPFATYMGDDTVLTKSYFGVQYLVNSYDSIVAPYLIRYGVYETELTKYLLNNIKPDTVFVDVGANIGYYTCFVAKKVAKAPGRVFAFEANERAFRLLQRNVMINWIDCPVSLEQIAVSDSRGEVYFKNYKYKFVNSQMAGSEDIGTMNEAEIVKVNTIPLDEYFKEGQHIDYMKIDVEGAELKVLNGAHRVIDSNPAIKILMEWSVPQLREQNTNPMDILDFFKSKGFTPSVLDWRDGSKQSVDYDYITQKGYICSVLFERNQ